MEASPIVVDSTMYMTTADRDGVIALDGDGLALESITLDGAPLAAEAFSATPDRLTIAHVLSMTLGTDWDEITFPYSDPRNSEIQMDAAPDRYRFILERPIVGEPGVKWTYCGGATALLGRLIAKGTGQSLHDFARTAMFEPLGLGPTEWRTGRDGEPLAASGIRMRAPDLLRIGRMVLGTGTWQGRQIVPAEWLKRSM